jgi:hypothetical protein
MIIKELAFNLQQIGIVALILVGLCAVTGVVFFGNRQEYREPTGICPSLVVPTHTPLPPLHLAKVAPSSPWTTVTATGTTPKLSLLSCLEHSRLHNLRSCRFQQRTIPFIGKWCRQQSL